LPAILILANRMLICFIFSPLSGDNSYVKKQTAG
jgi:hypothetical protein